MPNSHAQPLDLAGKWVAFTGKLATMTRSEAAHVIRSRGGRPARAVGRDTDVLVVGQEGLPLTSTGALTAKLEKARRLSEAGRLAILSEDEFLSRLGLTDSVEDVRRLYNLGQLGRILGVPRDKLRAWVRSGLITPAVTVQDVPFFDFRQATATKTLLRLARTGVTTSRVRRSLEVLRRSMPGLPFPLEKLALLEPGGELLFRLENGQLAEPNGQIRFDFPEDIRPFAAGTPFEPQTAEQWCEAGFEHEESGQLAEAADAYRRALQLGGADAQLCFNLGNVLMQTGQQARAAERFWQAVELRPNFAEAWNNLGLVLVELGEFQEAIRCYENALQGNPGYGDAHYNLAEALDQADRTEEARKHWQVFVHLEPSGAWAGYARSRLARG